MNGRYLSGPRAVVLMAILSASCPDNSGKLRTIGGTVSGLTGTGLVLQVNGGHDLPIPANANTFQFRLHFLEGSRYMVTVLSQPTSHGEVCTVVNGVGTLGTTDITDINVICSTDAYGVGGSVAGLTGSGLVLQLNEAIDLALSDDGSFTFPTKVARGASYKVTVKGEPTNPPETCTVENGTGTVTTEDVSDVTVICSTHAYTVGGSVTGLTGTGFVLQLNGQNDLPVSGGSFAFPKIASGATYTITVARQPTGPAQTCTVESGTGTVADANVTDVEVACANTLLVDGSECTGDYQCASSHCSCSDRTCDAAHRTCSALPCGACRYATTGASCDGMVDDGTGCSDGNACTTGDRCSGGSCVATGSFPCDDGNPCTDDSCDPGTGCVHVNNTASCSDGNACTTGDHCSGGSCAATGSLGCDDGNPCTNDSCNPATGCAHVNNTNSCTDSNPCTWGERCSSGQCVGGHPYTCSPDFCTAAAVCDGSGGCTATAPINEGVECPPYYQDCYNYCTHGYCLEDSNCPL